MALSYLRAPKPTVEGYRQAYRQMQAAVAELRERSRTFVKDGNE